MAIIDMKEARRVLIRLQIEAQAKRIKYNPNSEHNAAREELIKQLEAKLKYE